MDTPPAAEPSPTTGAAAGADDAALDERILAVFAREARIERGALRLDARADELGIASLDLAVALFELEDRFGVRLPEPPPGQPMPTVGALLAQVRAAVAARPEAQPQPLVA